MFLTTKRYNRFVEDLNKELNDIHEYNTGVKDTLIHDIHLLSNRINELSEVVKQNAEELAGLRETVKKKDIENSPEPYIEIIGEPTENEEGKVELRLEYNQAFMQTLVKSGYRGQTDDDIVAEWLHDTFSKRFDNQ